MNNLKKLLALLLCASMIFVMASCGVVNLNNDNNNEKTEEEEIEKEEKEEKEEEEELSDELLKGRWVAAGDLDDLMFMIEGYTMEDLIIESMESETGMDFSNFEFDEECPVSFVLDFDGVDEVELLFECDSFDTYVEEMIEETFDYILDPELLAELMGVTSDELEDLLEEEGMTMYEFMEYMESELGDPEDYAAELTAEFDLDDYTETGSYEIDDTHVIIDDDDDMPLEYADGSLYLDYEGITFAFEKE